MQPTPTKLKPGPKPITYIPPGFRHIPGVEQVSTVRQLDRLRIYVETSIDERPPYVRLGASVPQYSEDYERRPTCTYAVTTEGVISVIKMQRDPRAAERWFRNEARPWNLAARFASVEDGV